MSTTYHGKEADGVREGRWTVSSAGALGVSCDLVEVVEGEDPCGEEANGPESLRVGHLERELPPTMRSFA